MIGTFRSGAENIQLHHWANAKPAEVRSDTPEAQMPLRGRPRKAPPPASVQSDVQTTTESEPDIQTRKINKQPRVVPPPTRRSERILLRNHATSSSKRPPPSSVAPPPGFEHTRPSAGNSNQFANSCSDQSGTDTIRQVSYMEVGNSFVHETLV